MDKPYYEITVEVKGYVSVCVDANTVKNINHAAAVAAKEVCEMDFGALQNIDWDINGVEDYTH